MSIDCRVSRPGDPRSGPPPALTVELAFTDEDAVARLSGELDTDTARQLAALVEQVLRGQASPQGPVRRLVLDTAGLTFFCAAGITALLRARSAVAEHGVVLVLRHPAPIVRHVLEITGDLHRFATHDDEPAS